MATSASKPSFADRIRWDSVVKPWLVRLAIAAVFFLAGAYIFAPMLAARQANHLPTSYLALPLGAIEIANAEGAGALLPVRIAGTSQARSQGFRGVGEDALDGEFLLLNLARATTSRATYSIEGYTAATDFAAIDAEGNVVAVHGATPGGQRVAIPESHRWVLVGKAGMLERMGVTVGSTMDPESIRTF